MGKRDFTNIRLNKNIIIQVVTLLQCTNYITYFNEGANFYDLSWNYFIYNVIKRIIFYPLGLFVLKIKKTLLLWWEVPLDLTSIMGQRVSH